MSGAETIEEDVIEIEPLVCRRASKASFADRSPKKGRLDSAKKKLD